LQMRFGTICAMSLAMSVCHHLQPLAPPTSATANALSRDAGHLPALVGPFFEV
jgi:hypothetical protein